MLAVGERCCVLLRAGKGRLPAGAVKAVPAAITAAGRRWVERLGLGRFVAVGGNALALRQDLKVLAAGMSVERYLNHPTFGMLYRVCPVAVGEEIYATLYAQRMFFRVTSQPQGTSFEAMPFSVRVTTLSKTCCA